MGDLEQYLKEVAAIPRVSAKEEAWLIARIVKDEDAFDRLIRGNLDLVVKMAMSFDSHPLPLSDRINEGNLGLIRAAHLAAQPDSIRRDPRHQPIEMPGIPANPIPFSSFGPGRFRDFAEQWIRAAMDAPPDKGPSVA